MNLTSTVEIIKHYHFYKATHYPHHMESSPAHQDTPILIEKAQRLFTLLCWHTCQTCGVLLNVVFQSQLQSNSTQLFCFVLIKVLMVAKELVVNLRKEHTASGLILLERIQQIFQRCKANVSRVSRFICTFFQIFSFFPEHNS